MDYYPNELFHFYTKDWRSSDDWLIRGEGSSDECGRVKATYSSDDTNPDSNQSSDDCLSLYSDYKIKNQKS